jgi:hypothetical protein
VQKAPKADLIPRNVALKKLLRYHDRYAAKLKLTRFELTTLSFMIFYRP